MIRDHKFYEMQSALAATGQLTDAQLAELERHAVDCASCYECVADMAEVSREFFLVHARRTDRKAGPAGMQERFLERAACAGIPVSRSASTRFDDRFARVAAMAAVLVISLLISWRVFSPAREERTVASEPSTPGIQPGAATVATSPILRGRAADPVPAREEFSRRPPVRRRAVSTGPLVAAERSPGSFSDGRGLGPDRLYELPLPAHLSFTDAGVASYFGRKEERKPEERAFHLDPKLAALSFLDFPQNIRPEPHFDSLKFSAPIFHLDPTRVW